MYLRSLEDAELMKETIDECEGSVWLENETDIYDLKSAVPQYVGIARLFDKNNSLELFASSKADEVRLVKMLRQNPQMAS